MGKRTILLVACAVAVVTGVSLLMQRLPSEPSIPSQPPKANPPNWPVAKPIDVSQGGSTHAVPPVVEPVRPDDVRTQLVGLAISPVVKTIIGFDQDHRSKKDRRAALMKLNRKIPATDVKALRVFLSMRPRDQIGIDQNAFDNIRNEVLDVLFRQNHIPEAMGSQLVRMYRDGQQDDM